MNNFDRFLIALLQEVYNDYPYDEEKAKEIFERIINAKSGFK